MYNNLFRFSKIQSLMLLLLCSIYGCRTYPVVPPPMKQVAPLVIADEIEQLSSHLRDKKSINLLLEYELPSKPELQITTSMKKIYCHSTMLRSMLSYITNSEHNTKMILNYNFQNTKYYRIANQYFIDAQGINILRAFSTGRFPVFHTIKSLQKINRIVENKLKRENSHLSPVFNFNLFSTRMLFQSQLKRKDSMHNKIYDTSRHFLLLDDIKLSQRKSLQNYVYNEICNPVGIRITGKVSNCKKIVKMIQTLLQQKRNEEGNSIVIVFTRKQSRLIQKLLSLLTDKEKENLRFVNEVLYDFTNNNNKTMHRSNDDYKISNMKKDIRVFNRICHRLNINNNGLYLKFQM